MDKQFVGALIMRNRIYCHSEARLTEHPNTTTPLAGARSQRFFAFFAFTHDEREGDAR
jgi:hypothetical protein